MVGRQLRVDFIALHASVASPSQGQTQTGSMRCFVRWWQCCAEPLVRFDFRSAGRMASSRVLRVFEVLRAYHLPHLECKRQVLDPLVLLQERNHVCQQLALRVPLSYIQPLARVQLMLLLWTRAHSREHTITRAHTRTHECDDAHMHASTRTSTRARLHATSTTRTFVLGVSEPARWTARSTCCAKFRWLVPQSTGKLHRSLG